MKVRRLCVCLSDGIGGSGGNYLVIFVCCTRKGGRGHGVLSHLLNSHLLAPRAIPRDLASAGMLNHLGGAVLLRHRQAKVHQIGLTARVESVAGQHLRIRAGGARQPWPAILLGTLPTRTTSKPGPTDWAEETHAVQRP